MFLSKRFKKNVSKNVKPDHLTKVVQRFGTDVQKLRWKDGYMSRVEAVNLLIHSELRRFDKLFTKEGHRIVVRNPNEPIMLPQIATHGCMHFEFNSSKVLIELYDSQYEMFATVRNTVEKMYKHSVDLTVVPAVNTYKNMVELYTVSIFVASMACTIDGVTLRLIFHHIDNPRVY